MFEVNGTYVNRKGKYTVLSMGPDRMKVRYEDGSEAELRIAVQERIWENIRADVEASSSSRRKRATNDHTQFFIKTIPAIGDSDLNPKGIRALVTPTSSKAPDINVGDRFLYYALDTKSFFAVATTTAEPRIASIKEFAELVFDEDKVRVFPIDLDAFATVLSQAVWLDSVELESQPKFKELLVKPETYLKISEDDFELVAEMLTEFVEDDDGDDNIDDEDELELDDDLGDL